MTKVVRKTQCLTGYKLRRLFLSAAVLLLLFGVLIVPAAAVEYATGYTDIPGISVPVSIAQSETNPLYDPVYSTSFPSAYDLRDYGYVTSVKDQGIFGTCWAFSIMNALESNAIKQGYETLNSADFSELQLAYFLYNRDGVTTGDVLPELSGLAGDDVSLLNGATYLTYGGNFFTATPHLATGIGVAYETDVPYTLAAENLVLPPEYATAYNKYTIENAYFISIDDMGSVKQLLMEYGCGATSYYSTGKSNGYIDYNESVYLGEQATAYFQNTYTGTNHGVSIVGWDDNFPRENFRITPDNDGAWLVKNSWGTGFGDDGYFWISYEEPSLGDVVFYEVRQSDSSETAYQYDGTGSFEYIYNNYSYDGVFILGAMNVFTAESTEVISSVSFMTMNPDVYYIVSIGTETEDGGVMTAATENSTLTYCGYHTIELTTPVEVHEGQGFFVMVVFMTPDTAIDMYGENCLSIPFDSDVQYNDVKMDSSFTAEQGALIEGLELDIITDGAEFGNGGNFRIKAFGTAAEEEEPVPTVTPTPTPDDTVEGNTYIVGIDAEYPPFTYIDETGTPTGFDVESIQWIAENQGFNVIIQPTGWDGIVPALLAGNIDMIYAGMSITPARVEKVAFSDPYWNYDLAVAVQKGATITMDQFYNGEVGIGVWSGSSSAGWLELHFGTETYNAMVNSGQIKLFDSFPLSMTSLANGEVQTVLFDEAGIDEYLTSSTNLEKLGVTETGEQFAIAVRKDDTVLLAALNEGLAELMASEKWTELHQKYFGEIVSEHIHDDIAWTATNTLPTTAGSYYLTDDVYLAETWNAPIGGVNLCLNGHTVKFIGDDGSVISVPYDTVFALYDCKNTGQITGGRICHDNTGHGDGRGGGGGLIVNGTVSMYGGSINGNTATWIGGGVYVQNHGSFSMYGGNITGNTVTEDYAMGGGVFIDSINNNGFVYCGEFALYNGNITGNRATGVSGHGGGVYVNYFSSFIMQGGSITGNSAESGGGVETYAVWSTFNMSGGVISDNIARIGGGAYITSTFMMSGDAVIAENNDVNLYEKIILTGTEFTGSARNITGSRLSPGTDVIVVEGGYTAQDIIDKFAPRYDYFTFSATDEQTIRVFFTDSIYEQRGVNDYHHTLIDDVTLMEGLHFNSGTTHLDLNGHSLCLAADFGGDVICVSNSDIFNLYDNSSEKRGKITRSSSGRGISVTGDSCTFNMYGGNITGNYNIPNLGSGFGGGVEICMGATFNMYTGSIMGNSAGYGGGVCVDNRGVFNMYGGSITENSASSGGGISIWCNGFINVYNGTISRNSANSGGGVSVWTSFTDMIGEFTMYGGTISANSANDGGGVSVHEACAFTMYGGNITENSASNGGGVYSEEFGSVTLSSSLGVSDNRVINITENFANGQESNMYLSHNATMNLYPLGLTNGTQVGITTEYLPSSDKPVAITNMNYLDQSEFFFSDKSGYYVENRENILYLVANIYTITIDTENDGMVSAYPTSATVGTTVILTPTANDGYQFKEWIVESGGVTIKDNTFTMPASDVSIKAIFEPEQEISTLPDALSLKAGWNFVSVPKYLNSSLDTALELFGGLNTNGNSLLGYDAQTGWFTLKADTAIEPLDAYWVYSVEPVTIELGYSEKINTPATKPLYRGWNAVGLSAETSMNALDVFAGLDWLRYLPWDLSSQGWGTPVIKGGSTEGTMVTLGNGGWLYVNADGTYLGNTA